MERESGHVDEDWHGEEGWAWGGGMGMGRRDGHGRKARCGEGRLDRWGGGGRSGDFPQYILHSLSNCPTSIIT